MPFEARGQATENSDIRSATGFWIVGIFPRAPGVAGRVQACAAPPMPNTGPITLPEKLGREETVFSEDTSVLFKETCVVRMWDEKNRVLVYLAISRKLIEGAPANAISTVPVMPWGGR
jgi:hypothetical protein